MTVFKDLSDPGVQGTVPPQKHLAPKLANTRLHAMQDVFVD